MTNNPKAIRPWRPDAWAYFAAHAPACPENFMTRGWPKRPASHDFVNDGLGYEAAMADYQAAVNAKTAQSFAEWAGAYADAMMAEYAKVAK